MTKIPRKCKFKVNDIVEYVVDHSIYIVTRTEEPQWERDKNRCWVRAIVEMDNEWAGKGDIWLYEDTLKLVTHAAV